MKVRFASALFALALPMMAQQDSPAAENLFYKAYWLEKGERNFAEAIGLYEQFLAQAPEHRLAKQAATFEYDLLTRAGKAKEAEAFAKKYEKLLGNVAAGAPAAGQGRGEGRGERGERGEGRQAGAGGDMAARVAELKKQLDEAKASGDTEKVAQLERRIKAMEQMGQGGDAARGQGNRRGGFGTPVEFAKMDKEQLDQFKTQRLERMTAMIERMRENGAEDQAKQAEESIAALKKALDDGKLDEAQKVWDKMMESMPRGRRGGGGGGGEGGEGGGRRPAGGGGDGGDAPPRRGGGGGDGGR